MSLKLILLACFAFLTGISSAQNMRFTGVVNDTINNKPLENAIVMAVRLSDGLMLGFTRTKADGSFELTTTPIETIELVVSHYKFDDKRFYIIGSAENYEIDIPNIILPEVSTKLEEVIVYANKEPIYFRGDTLVYVADSFARKENAVVEDLLKNLPGITVDGDGNITSQGRQVTKVLVDGDEFFGADPTIATRNLMADGVSTIEIYETEDETSGGNSEEKIQVLDVRLKEDAKKGYFGKVSALAGVNAEKIQGEPGGRNFYQGELLANYFNKDTKISVFGLGSNTPNSGFNYRDASRFGLTNEMSGGWQSQFMGRGNQAQGLPTSYKGGFYFSHKFNNKTKVGLNYTYNDNALVQREDRTSQFFFADTSYTTNENRIRDQQQVSHTVNFTVEHQIDSLTTLELNSNLTMRNESEYINNTTDFFSSSALRTNGTRVENNSLAQGLEGNINLKLIRKFNKRNRKFTAEYQYGYSENERENFMVSEINNLLTTDTLFNFNQNQRRDINNKTQGHRALLDYDEPLSRRLKLNFQYKLDYFYGTQSNITNDRDVNNEYTDFSSFYSNDFTNDRIENRVGMGVVWTPKKQTISVGTRARNVMIDNLNNFTNDVITQNVNNILPYIEYTYKFSNSQRFRFSYTTSSDQPSLNQLQPVPDNTNPNNVVIGNPKLVPNYNHAFNGFYNKWNALQQSYIWASAYANYTNNSFSDSIIYAPDGRTVSSAINVDGVLYAGIFAGGGVPMFNKFLRWDPNVNISYSNFKSEINIQENIQENITENWSYTAGSNFSIRNDTIEVSIGADITYADPRSSLSLGANQPYWLQSYKAEIFFELPLRFFIESDARYIVNTQRALGFNVNPFIWNAKLNRRFGKTGNFIVHFEANDILNQNVGINRMINNNVITDTRNVIIARYFMVGATLRFNNNKTKEDEGRGRMF